MNVRGRSVSQASPSNNTRFSKDRCGRPTDAPDQNVTLLFDHDEMHALALVFADKRVRYEVQKHVREEAARLMCENADTRQAGERSKEKKG